MFTSKAINAQGTVLSIDDGTGVAISDITAITKAAAAVVSSVAASVAVGDYVRFGVVAGMPEIEGMVGRVTAVTAGTSFTVNIDTTGFAEAGTTGAAEQLVFVAGCEVKTFNGFDGQANEIDITTLCSTAKETMLGLQDPGNFNFTANLVPDDPFQVECNAAKAAQEKRFFTLTLPPTEGGDQFEYAFNAYVRQLTISGGVDQALSTDGVLRISGEVLIEELA